MSNRRLHHRLIRYRSTPNTATPPLSHYSRLLRSCNHLPTLRQIHARLLTLGLASHSSAAASLINSYSSFNDPHSAASVFSSSPTPTTLLLNSMLRCYARTNRPTKAIQLYRTLPALGLDPDKYTFTFVLKACAGALDADTGAEVHEEIVESGLEQDVFIGTGLVDMYAKMGRVEIARKVFESMPVLDVVTWNAMIAGFAQGGEPCRALERFREMCGVAGVEPNSVSLLNLFPAVCEMEEARLCRSVHGFIVRKGVSFTAVFNGLIDTYSKCGAVELAQRVFNGMGRLRDDVSWASLISGYVHNRFFWEALEVFDEMRGESSKLNQVSVVSALSAAAEIGDLERGIDVHNYAIEKRVEFDVQTTTVLMTMYAKCGDIEKARLLFEGIKRKDIIAWSAIISALAQTGCPKEALFFFREMVVGGVVPNQVTIVGVLPACGDLLDVKAGKSIHCYALRSGIDVDRASVGTALVSMYAQCELFTSAHAVFDAVQHKEVITWNTLINGYAQIGDASNALKMFQQLRWAGEQPDPGTLVGVLPACALLDAFDLGASVHGLSIKNGYESDVHVKNATVDMYAKCADLRAAEVLFSELKSREDVISSNTMIAGYVHNGNTKQAMSVFHEMRARNIKPNAVTLVSIIPAAALLASVRDGSALHSIVIRTGFESHVLVGNSLIDMYSKCGRIDYARDFFNLMVCRDTVSWNVMLAGYAMHGLSESSIALFAEMKGLGIRADSMSFLGILSACRHGGLVEEGKRIFETIGAELASEPRMEHYACMVDLLGRSGQFDEAWGLIQRMPMAPDAGVWGALLGACRMHCNVRMGEMALENLVRLEPQNPAHYVALLNIYAQVGRWSDARRMRAAMSDAGMSKAPGYSWA